jgi:hypothetical protein
MIKRQNPSIEALSQSHLQPYLLWYFFPWPAPDANQGQAVCPTDGGTYLPPNQLELHSHVRAFNPEQPFHPTQTLFESASTPTMSGASRFSRGLRGGAGLPSEWSCFFCQHARPQQLPRRRFLDAPSLRRKASSSTPPRRQQQQQSQHRTIESAPSMEQVHEHYKRKNRTVAYVRIVERRARGDIVRLTRMLSSDTTR